MVINTSFDMDKLCHLTVSEFRVKSFTLYALVMFVEYLEYNFILCVHTCSTPGRDPLLHTQHKPDIAAVASTLKAYFRELTIPLFPTEKYREFINCTRHDDLQDRLDFIQQTVAQLQPTVIEVMKYLFRFLSRVAEHSSENKMGSANLALVFGPTLMRAPDAIDPRQLHTDVPSVNILIQLCIDQNIYIYGDEEEEEEELSSGGRRIEQQRQSNSPSALAVDTPSELEASFELTTKVTVLSTSPPLEPPKAPPTTFVPLPQVHLFTNQLYGTIYC